MLVFWLLATLMIAVALAFVLVPLLRARTIAAPSRVAANLEVLRGQRREIEADIANGVLPAAARDEALADLLTRADADLEQAPATEAPVRRPWIVAASVAIFLPLVALTVYLVKGLPAATDPQVARIASGAPMDEKQVIAMVERLAERVRERPDDVQGVALLARSMAALGRYGESAAAYEQLARLVPNDADVLADWADALGMAQGRKLAGQPAQIAQRALAIDPKHPKSLALAGTAALDAGDTEAALRHWQGLLAQLEPDSDDARQVRAIVGDILAKSAASGAVLGAAPPQAPVSAAAKAKAVSGTVSAAPALADKVDAGDTLYIYARAVNGPRFPLAVWRGKAARLPTEFNLDDTLSMAPDRKLSTAEAVQIEARVSRSGNAAPQPGDLVGTSEIVAPGARGVKIVIDKVLP